MKAAIRLTLLLAIVVLWSGSAVPISAATIFDNSVNDLIPPVQFNPGTNEVGDEITLAGSERTLNMFSFEYWGTNTAGGSSFSGSVQARVRFYENNGTLFNGYSSPGTNFFDSGWFSVNATPRSTLIFTDGADWLSGSLTLPASNMTWSVQFEGMGANDTVGVDIFAPPVVGQDPPDYWEYDSPGAWALLQNTNGIPMDFAAKMETPEPSSIRLSLLGGLGILTMMRRLRRKV